MLNEFFFGGSGIVTITSQPGGIDLFFNRVSWSRSSDGGGTLTYTFSPGIPVSSSVSFYTDNTGSGKYCIAQINPGQPDAVTAPGINYPTVSYSGTITTLAFIYGTNDDDGDNFEARVLNIDGAQNYTKIDSTTMTVP